MPRRAPKQHPKPSRPRIPPTHIRVTLTFDSLMLPFLTDYLNMAQSVVIRVPRNATKTNLEHALEGKLFRPGPLEEHELFKHGRRPQWRWNVFVRRYDMVDEELLEDDEHEVGTFAGPDGRAEVEVRGCMDFDPGFQAIPV